MSEPLHDCQQCGSSEKVDHMTLVMYNYDAGGCKRWLKHSLFHRPPSGFFPFCPAGGQLVG